MSYLNELEDLRILNEELNIIIDDITNKVIDRIFSIISVELSKENETKTTLGRTINLTYIHEKFTDLIFESTKMIDNYKVYVPTRPIKTTTQEQYEKEDEEFQLRVEYLHDTVFNEMLVIKEHLYQHLRIYENYNNEINDKVKACIDLIEMESPKYLNKIEHYRRESEYE